MTEPTGMNFEKALARVAEGHRAYALLPGVTERDATADKAKLKNWEVQRAHVAFAVVEEIAPEPQPEAVGVAATGVQAAPSNAAAKGVEAPARTAEERFAKWARKNGLELRDDNDTDEEPEPDPTVEAAEEWLWMQPDPTEGHPAFAVARLARELFARDLCFPQVRDLLVDYTADWCSPMGAEEVSFLLHYVQDFDADRAAAVLRPLRASAEPYPTTRADLLLSEELQAHAPAPAAAVPEVEPVNPFLGTAQAPPRVPVPYTRVIPFEAKALRRTRWIVDGMAGPGRVTLLVAPPGTGKSAFALALALAAATGRGEIVGATVPAPAPAWVFNIEDDAEVLRGRLLAAMRAHGVEWEHIGDRLGLDSGTERPLRLVGGGDKAPVPGLDLGDVEAHIRKHGIKLLILDPIVELHNVGENDNMAMAKVLGYVRALAARTDCAIILAAHTRKPLAASSEGHAGNMDSARGASAMVGAARTVLTLESMSEKDAKRYGVRDEGERIRYVRLDDAKNNYTLKRHGARWFKRESVVLDNGEDVVALVPAQLEEVAAKEEIEAARLAADAVPYIGDGGRMPVNALAKKLIAEAAMYLEEKPSTLRDRLTRAFASPRDVNGRTWRYVNAQLEPNKRVAHWIASVPGVEEGENEG